MTAQDVARLLPGIPRLRDLCRSLATLDAVLSPDWELRYYSFDGRWASGAELASMRNGSGDEYSIVFGQPGAYIRGFDHESPMSPYANEDYEPWPGVIDSVPEVFRRHVKEPAFCDEDGVPAVTACLWRATGAPEWRAGDIEYPPDHRDPDGSAGLFELLIEPTPEAYQRFAEDYYEVPVDLDAVRHVYALRPLTQEVVSRLNAEISVDSLTDDLQTIGYR